MNRLSRSPTTVHMPVCLAVALLVQAGSAHGEDLFPPELVHWTAYKENPVFAGRGEGHWDARIRERGWILRQGDRWQMWYTGYDGSRDGLKMLGYATSNDGLHWQRADKPLYDMHWVEDMMVVLQDGTYYMFAEGRGDRAHLLTSKDGQTWRRIGRLDVRKANGQPIEPGPYGTPTAWFEQGTWYLFYERRDAGIWLATSQDMRVWRNVQDAPVLRPGQGPHDKDLIALNQIVKYKGRYYACYHGAENRDGPDLWTSNLATSPDLIHWKKYSGNPLLPIERNESSNILVHDGDRWRMYTMHDQVRVYFSDSRSGDENEKTSGRR